MNTQELTTQFPQIHKRHRSQSPLGRRIKTGWSSQLQGNARKPLLDATWGERKEEIERGDVRWTPPKKKEREKESSNTPKFAMPGMNTQKLTTQFPQIHNRHRSQSPLGRRIKTGWSSQLQGNARKPLLHATWGHRATTHIRKDKCGKGPKVATCEAHFCKRSARFGLCKTWVLSVFGQRPGLPGQAKQRLIWARAGETREITRFLKFSKTATNSKKSIKPLFFCVWPPKERPEVNTCQKWPPFCRVFGWNGLQTAEQSASKPRSTAKIAVWVLSPSPWQKNGRFLVSKNGLKTRERSAFRKWRPPNAGFKQTLPKNGLLSAGFLCERPSRWRMEGVQSAKHYKNRGPDASKKK